MWRLHYLPHANAFGHRLAADFAAAKQGNSKVFSG
jgi:hypothetical protein